MGHFVALRGGNREQGEEREERIRMGDEGEAMLTNADYI